jgi:hypothetical protein
MDRIQREPNAVAGPKPLIEATRQALDAAAVGDLDALHKALGLRRAALPHAPIAEQVAAFKEGEALQFLLKGIKRGLREEIGRLEQIKVGLLRSAEPPRAKIDLRA